MKYDGAVVLEGLSWKSREINLLLIKRGKIMEIWKFENFLPRRSWNREKLEEVFIEYASTDLNSKRREFFASNYCCNGVEQQQITIWNGVKRFTTYLRDIARGDRLAETVNKSVTQYSWRNTINKTRATIDQNLFETSQSLVNRAFLSQPLSGIILKFPSNDPRSNIFPFAPPFPSADPRDTVASSLPTDIPPSIVRIHLVSRGRDGSFVLFVTSIPMRCFQFQGCTCEPQRRSISRIVKLETRICIYSSVLKIFNIVTRGWKGLGHVSLLYQMSYLSRDLYLCIKRSDCLLRATTFSGAKIFPVIILQSRSFEFLERGLKVLEFCFWIERILEISLLILFSSFLSVAGKDVEDCSLSIRLD